MIFSLNLISFYSHIWYSCLFIVHLPKCSIISSIFRSRFLPILSFFEFRFRLSEIPNFTKFRNPKITKSFCHVILNKNSFLILKQWINSHCRKNYPNMFFLVKQLNWNSSLQTLFIITLTRCNFFSENFLKNQNNFLNKLWSELLFSLILISALKRTIFLIGSQQLFFLENFQTNSRLRTLFQRKTQQLYFLKRNMVPNFIFHATPQRKMQDNFPKFFLFSLI